MTSPTNRTDEVAREVVRRPFKHPETGVSLVDDVRDLVKERDRFKNTQVDAVLVILEQSKELTQLKLALGGAREALEACYVYFSDGASDQERAMKRSIGKTLAKAALEGTQPEKEK